MPLESGTRIGPYLVVESLKQGDFGTSHVYRVRLHGSAQYEFALKLSYAMQFGGAWSEDEQHALPTAEMLPNEVNILPQLRHPSVVKIVPLPGEMMPYAYVAQARDLPGEPWYWTLEFLAGGSLQQVLDRGALNLRQSLQIGHQICEALDYLHAKGIAHLNLNPLHVLFRESWADVELPTAVLISFEHARQLSLPPSEPGSLSYIAPEHMSSSVLSLLEAREIDQRPTDVYALGVMIYQMVTGRLPFARGANGNGDAARHEPPPLSQFNAQVDKAVDEMVAQSLSKDPARRPPISEFAAVLEKAIWELPSDTHALRKSFALVPSGARRTIYDWTRPKSRSVLWWLNLGLVAAVLLLLLSVVTVRFWPTTAAGQNSASPTPSPIAIAVPSTTASAPLIASTSVTPTASAPLSGNATTAPTAVQPTPTVTLTPLPSPTPTTPAASQLGLTGQFIIPVCLAPCESRAQQHLMLVSPDGATRRIIVNMATDPQFQPDGKRIIFRSLANKGAAGNRSDGLYYYDLQDGRDDYLVSNLASDTYPVFMRDRILFASERESALGSRLYIVNKYNSADAPRVIGADVQQLRYRASWPAFSEATGLVAYAGCLEDNCGIWTTGAKGYAQVEACCQISAQNGDSAPDWSPDGARLAFVSQENGSPDIYVVNSNGSDRKRLTTQGINVAPNWSPDGQWVAFLSDRDGQWAVWVIKPEQGAEPRKLFELGTALFEPVKRRMDWGIKP